MSPKILIGAVIKHNLNIADRETEAQITENMYLRYCLVYSSYIKRPPFDPPLFVEIRKRLRDDLIAEMNDKIYEFSQAKTLKKNRASPQVDGSELDPIHKGEVIFDATACPQDIAYPTDIGLLDRSREIT